MVTPFAAQILFKTKFVVIRTVTMCWKHPHPLSLGAPFFVACISASWHLALWAILGGCWFWRSPTLEWAWAEIFFLQMKRTSYLIQMVCMWKIQHPRGGLLTGPWMVWKYQSKEHCHQQRAKPHCASNSAQLLWPWWHDSIFLYLGLFICKMEIVILTPWD